MLNSLTKNSLFLFTCLCTYFSQGQDYSWKVELKVNPIHVFFDGTPVYDAGYDTGFKLRSLNFFDDKFKESKSIGISKRFGKNQLQFCYSTHNNAYYPALENIDNRFTFVRVFRDFNLNYLRNSFITSNEKISFSWGAGLWYRHGFEMRIYEPHQVGSRTLDYYLRDVGINLILQIDYKLTDRFQLFAQCNFLSTVINGDKASKEFFDNYIWDQNYRPQRFNFSLGFGLSYNFNFKRIDTR